VNSKDKYPELKEFLERIKIYADDLKEMKREIIMPINNDDYLRDVVLENKLLGYCYLISSLCPCYLIKFFVYV
jgi:disulfide oxidoreductase YuzD